MQYADAIEAGNIFFLKTDPALQLLLWIISYVIRCPILYYEVKFTDYGRNNEAEDVEEKEFMSSFALGGLNDSKKPPVILLYDKARNHFDTAHEQTPEELAKEFDQEFIEKAINDGVRDRYV